MNDLKPLVHSVLHATDFSGSDEHAFAHALAIALLRKAELAILHSAPDAIGEDEWRKYPSVRRTLERWGLLERGSPRSAVFRQLSVAVTKIEARSRSPQAAIANFVAENRVDLIVLATEGRDGLPRWLRPSVAEATARRAETMALFVPREGRGFVSPECGEITLRNVLIPVDAETCQELPVRAAANAVRMLGDEPVTVTLCHVGDGAPLTDIVLPEQAGTVWQKRTRDGDVVEGILATADDTDADLIVMATQGRDGILDVLRGSTSERVLRRAGRPVLTIPASWIS